MSMHNCNALEDVRRVLKHDKNKIIQKYSAEGVGIGKVNDEFVIVVYMDKAYESNDSAEHYWCDIPLKFEYGGKIMPQ